MAKLEDLLNPKSKIVEFQEAIEEHIEQTTDNLPDYLLNDPEIVGYPDEEFQLEIYDWAMSWAYNSKVADVGCGRGDFYGRLSDFSLKKPPEYIGFETNPLMVSAAKKKHVGINVYQENFLDYAGENFDHIFWIGTLNSDYGHFDLNTFAGRYDYFLKNVRHGLKYCNNSLIFILLNSAEDGFIAHPIPTITDFLLKENQPFEIDYSKFQDIYKLTIFKNND